MNPLRLARLSLQSVWLQRRRAWPAASGIAVGVAAMVAMVAVGQGAEHSVLEKIRAMGSDLVVLSAGQVKVVGGRPRQVGNVTTLTVDDARALADLPSVARVAPVQTRRLLLKWGDLATTSNIVGTTADFLGVRNFAVASGRFFDDEEERAALRVAVVGTTVAQNLFGERDPVGETLRIGRVPFLVVGVLAPKGLDANGGDQDDQVLVPVRTALRRLFNLDHLENVYLQARPGRAALLVEEAGALMRERHRTGKRGDDFTLQNQADVLAAEQSAARSFTFLLAAVSAVALLIGGVGVLAVMLIAVRERVREIGLRRAIGASRRDVLLQFVGEALVIGLAGSVLGAVVGALAAQLVSVLGSWPVLLSASSTLVAAAVSVAVAVAFGSVPARRAATLDPANALRSA